VRSATDLHAGDVVDLTFADDHKKAVIDPQRATEAPPVAAEAPKSKPKPKPGGDQGSLF
jgi:hypothetical protein